MNKLGIIPNDNIRLKLKDTNLCISKLNVPVVPRPRLGFKPCVESDPSQVLFFSPIDHKGRHMFIIKLTQDIKFAFTVESAKEVNNNDIHLWEEWKTGIHAVAFSFHHILNGSYYIKSLNGKCIGGNNPTVKENDKLVIADCGKNSQFLAFDPIKVDFPIDKFRLVQGENLRLKAVDSDLCVTNKGETHLVYKKCVDSNPEQIFSFKSNNFQDNNYFLMNLSRNPQLAMSIFNGNEVNNNYLNLWGSWRTRLNPVVFRYELLKNGSYHIKSLSGKCIGSQNQTVKEDENLVINDCGGKNSELVVIPPVTPNFSGKNKIELGTKYRFKIQDTELCMTNMKNDKHPDLGLKNCDKNNINQIFYIQTIN